MSKASPPELKKFMDKKLGIQINSGRKLNGVLRGYDPFMNIVLDECVEMLNNGQTRQAGMVVIRGNSIIMLEAYDRIWRKKTTGKPTTLGRKMAIDRFLSSFAFIKMCNCLVHVNLLLNDIATRLSMQWIPSSRLSEIVSLFP